MRPGLAILLLAAAPWTASAQTVVFQEGFEAGLAGWTIGPDSPTCRSWEIGFTPACTGTWLPVDGADPDGRYLRVRLGDGTVHPADLVVAASGRVPGTADLDLAAAGVTADADGVRRDARTWVTRRGRWGSPRSR